MAIHLETFTSLIEFVKNHLVKIESPCLYPTPYLRNYNGPKILSDVNQTTKYLSNQAHYKPNIITTDKAITTSSNPIHLRLNNE